MGSEMSCPCEKKREILDDESIIIDKYKSFRFGKEHLLFNYYISNIKICVIPSDKLENFFKNKFTLRHQTKPNTYYTNIKLTNFIKNSDQCLVILENFEPYTDSNLRNSHNIENLDQYKFNYDSNSDYTNDYQVNEFNLLSNDVLKMQELIYMNLNVMLKKDYVLMGIINSSNKNTRDFKMLFRKMNQVENDLNYEVIIHENTLTQTELKRILSKNKDKKLNSVLILTKIKENSMIKYYFLIFEIPKFKTEEKDFLLIELKKKNIPDEIFNEDLAIKLHDLHNYENYLYKLSCVFNDEDSLFLILSEEEQAIDDSEEIDQDVND